MKKTLSIILTIALVMSCLTLPAFANTEELQTLIDSPLTDLSAAAKNQGFANATWAAGRCGLSGRTVYYTDGSKNSYLIFDAGKDKAFKEVSFDLTYGVSTVGDITESAFSLEMGATGATKRNNLIAYGNDTAVMKAAGCGEYEYIFNGSADGQTGNYFTFTVTWTLPEPARYVRLNGDFYGNCGMFVHNAVLKGVDYEHEVAEPEVLVDSDLVSDTPYSTELSEGIYIAGWNGLTKSLGVTDNERNFISNNAAKTWLVFDAGEGNIYTSAEFDISSSTDKQGDWYFTQTAHDNNRVFYSNDGSTWNSIFAPVEITHDGSSYALRATIKVDVPSARYVKVGHAGMWPNGHGMFYHRAKLLGFKTPAQLLIDTDLSDDSQVSSISGFAFYDWASARCGYTTKRNILGTTSAGELIFRAGSDKTFNGAEFKITVHQNANWTVNEKVWRDKFVSTSTDGITYTPLAPLSYVQGDDTVDDQNNPHKNYTLSYEFGDAAFVKFSASSLNASLYIHGAKLYGKLTVKDLVEFEPVYIEEGITEWRTTAKMAYNCEGTKNITVFMLAKDGDTIRAIKPFFNVELSNTATEKMFTVHVGDTAMANPDVKLFVWGTNLKPVVKPVVIK